MLFRFPHRAGTSFEQLLQPHVQHLYQLAYRFCQNQDDAEDLVQDVLIKLYPRYKELQTIQNLRPWLAKVLYRQFVDQYRQKERSPLNLVSDYQSLLETQADKSEIEPENAAETTQLQHQLQQVLATLNSDQHAVVILHDVEGFTLSELEIILDTPIGTLKSRLNRARGQLRKLLQETED
ncbi:MAG: RNA polymerase sigma factor [Gammaproteobacteria bacterium]|nr:RNA polymerase sigma factor [Gammaproteobacteria bacterium]